MEKYDGISAENEVSSLPVEVISQADSVENEDMKISNNSVGADSWANEPHRTDEMPTPEFLLSSIRQDLMSKLVKIEKKFKANTRWSDT